MGSVSRRIRNNVIARKAAINAGLVVPPGVDPMFPEGVGLHRSEWRDSMLRGYRQRRSTRKMIARAGREGRKAGREHAKQSPDHQPTPWYKRAWRTVKKILPNNAR